MQKTSVMLNLAEKRPVQNISYYFKLGREIKNSIYSDSRSLHVSGKRVFNLVLKVFEFDTLPMLKDAMSDFWPQTLKKRNFSSNGTNESL